MQSNKNLFNGIRLASLALILAGIGVMTGCNSSAVESEYMTLDQLKKHPKFRTYRILEGPGVAGQFKDVEGPYKLNLEVNSTVAYESRSPFHRSARMDGVDYEFIDDEGKGYGFRCLSVENEKGEKGIFFLKTVNKKKSIRERNPETYKAIDAKKKRRQIEDQRPRMDRFRDRLKDSDKDKDGKISKSEIHPRMLERFPDFDKDGDELLDKDEQEVMIQELSRPNSDEDKKASGENKADEDKGEAHDHSEEGHSHEEKGEDHKDEEHANDDGDSSKDNKDG